MIGRFLCAAGAATVLLGAAVGPAEGVAVAVRGRAVAYEEGAGDEDGGREEVEDEAIARLFSERRPAEGPVLGISWLCDMDHPLLPAVKDSTFVCDVCERDLAAGTTFVLCEECDYSLCATCFKRGLFV